MTRSSKTQRTGFVAIVVAALLAVWVMPAAADGTSGSFCYEGSTTTTSSSYNTGAGYPTYLVLYASATYKMLYNCSGTAVGVHVISVTASYSGGYNGTGDYGSHHGMDQMGLDYMKYGDPAGNEIYAGSLVSVSGYPRQYTYSANKYIYSGTGHNDGRPYSFTDTSVFAHYYKPYNRGTVAGNVVGWFIFLRNQWVVYNVLG
jgi:hypothetical protein